jgi:ribonuclease R
MPRAKRGRKKTAEPAITKEEILRHIRKLEGRTANLHGLLETFDATPQARRQIKDILVQLVRDGQLEQHKGNRYEAKSRNLIDGTIVLHRDGYGFVIPAQKIESLGSDIFIPPPMTGSAMNGDKVQIEIVLHKPGGRAEGRVVNVTKRVRDTIVGQLRFDGQVFFVAPMDEKLPSKILITNDAAEHKDKIVEVEITRYPSAAAWPAGKVVNVIGFLDDPNVETVAIIRKFGFPTSFPKDVDEEAEQLPEALGERDYLGRDDFRSRNTITIDPTTARDFDDAVDVEILKDGTFQLGVHIADVSHFVRVDSAMDTEARIRGTSVYFPDRVIPMLPEKVSNSLCSLNPRVDRLTMSVIMHISQDGEVRDYSVHNSVIHSKERMTYEDVQKMIDGDASLTARFAHILPEVRKINKLALILQKKRQERGAIDFDLPEPMLTYDESGGVLGIVKSIRHFSHRIIEEFMILANEVVARHLEVRDIPSLYRVHEDPDPAKVADFAELVAGFGLRFHPKRATPAEFQKFISSIAGRPEERMLSYLMLRSFKQAIYSADNIGHFGLASDAYTHFTSPIRRYPDLVVHRILKPAIARRKNSIATGQLEAIASESSERERTADQAERELMDWKKMILIERHLGDTFEAIIIAVWKDGFTVELIDQFIEGFVSASDLPADQYRFDPVDRVLASRNAKSRFRIGDRLPVQVARVDRLLRRAYFVPLTKGMPGGRLAGRKRSR